jgi:DNA polymerase
MTPFFYDYETYWAQGHSLSNMTPIEYVGHSDTEIISMAYRDGVDGDTKVVFGEDSIAQVFSEYDWSERMMVAHNGSEFDHLITAYKFDIRPKMWGCTLAMARPIHAKGPGGSLKKLAEHYGLQAKGDLLATNTKGKHLRDFTHGELVAMAEYNKVDVDILVELFKRLLPETPKEEMVLMDLTMKMLTNPQFLVDTALLEDTLTEETARKTKLLEKLAEQMDLQWLVGKLGMGAADPATAVKTTLSSAPQFKKFLEDHGVSVPMKLNTKGEKMIPALAKTDAGMQALLEHEDELIRTAAEVRLDVKSTLLETRLGRFLNAADFAEGKMPIALRYYGADTTGRWSGTFKLNQQNLPRVNPKKPQLTDALRKCLIAPAGHRVVVADLSGIELRVNHFLWQVGESMDLFNADPVADLYIAFAAYMYDIMPEQVTKEQRQLAKVAQLGLGFGAGPSTFRSVAKTMGGIDLSDSEAKRVVFNWRDKYHKIASGWQTCQTALQYMEVGGDAPIDPWGLCRTTQDGIVTPKGVIRYPGLHRETVEGKQEYFYGEGRNRTKIYAGKVTENIVQHLARSVISDAMLKFNRTELGDRYKPAHTVHDELIYVAREEDAQGVLDTLQGIMRTPPDWWPELVTWSEGETAGSYGEAK